MSPAPKPRRLQALAPAKLNLGLEVIRRRRDGYHEIETIFQTIDLCDELEFRLRPDESGLTLREKGLPLPEGEVNIVELGYNLMSERFGRQATGVEIVLRKNIPPRSGLGGGSSDAAALILALDRMWGLQLEYKALQDLALELGSDVPFLLRGGTAIGRGRGDELIPLPPLSQGAFLLVNPGFGISTAWAFSGLKMGLTGNPYRISVEQVKAYLSRFPARGMMIRNRFEDVVYPAHPVFEEIAGALEEQEAVHVSMTGSGATVFGTFPDLRAAERARDELGDKWKSYLARPQTGGVELMGS